MLVVAVASAPLVAEAHSSGVEKAEWFADAGVLPVLLMVAAWYLTGWQILRRRAPSSAPVVTAACFIGGCGVALLALASPIDALGSRRFWVHMIQHELLMLACAPLLVLGQPLLPCLWALPATWRRRLGLLSRGYLTSAIWRTLSRPGIAALLHATVIWTWHLPALFELALANGIVHALQHLSYLLTACLFWHAVLSPVRRRDDALRGMLWVFLTCVHTSMLGALLLFSAHPYYSAYALDDQRLGGVIMWVPGGLVYLLAMAWILRHFLEEPAALRFRRAPQ